MRNDLLEVLEKVQQGAKDTAERRAKTPKKNRKFHVRLLMEELGCYFLSDTRLRRRITVLLLLPLLFLLLQ